MKKLLIISAIFLLSIAMAGCGEKKQETLYEQANKNYEKGNYQAAYDQYQKARAGFVKEDDAVKAYDCRVSMRHIDKIRAEYPHTKEEAKKILSKEFKDIPASERNAWLDNGKADSITIEGKPYYFGEFVKNLKFRDKSLMKKDPEGMAHEATFFRNYHDMIFRSQHEEYSAKSWRPYINPVEFMASGALSIAREKLPETGLLRLWIPLPVQTAAQDNIRVISINPAKYMKLPPRTSGDIGLAYMEIPLEELKGDLDVSVDFLFKHYQQRFIVDPNNVGKYDWNSFLYKEYTRSWKNISITKAIRQKAKEIVGKERNPYLAAKKIYDYVVNHIQYSFMPHLTLNVLGSPESVFVHEKGYGDCGAQSVYFSALCRAAGIPARTTGGMQLCPENPSDHFWAEFYLPNYGWIPVDTSVAQTAELSQSVTKEQDKIFKDFFFAGQDPYRYVIQKDVDVPLIPDPGEPIFLPMAVQFPAVVCQTSEKDPGFIVSEGWSIEFKPVNA